MHYVGKLRLDQMPARRGVRGLPDLVVKVALSHWYLRPTRMTARDHS
jgi:hypothetical protein